MLVLLAFLAAGLFIALGWTGFIAADDLRYARAAAGWARHVPFLATDHWGVRHAVVLPMAVAFRVGGISEATLAVPAVLYAASLLLLVFLLAGGFGDSLAAALAVVLLGGVPAIVDNSTIVVEDPAEALFILLSLVTFHDACRRGRTVSAVLSGVCAGVAYITRETTVALLVLYGVLFLLDYGGARMRYVWMGLGFCAVVAIDTAYLGWMSGDWLYRAHLSLAGIAADNPVSAVQVAPWGGLNRFGMIATGRWLQPLVVLFLNQKYGLFFWFAIPATVWAAFGLPKTPQRDFVRLLAAFALTWVAILGYVLIFLWVTPRYFSVVAVALSVPVALALARLLRSRWRVLAVLAIVLLVTSNGVLIAAADRQPLFAERFLVQYVLRHPGIRVDTDPGTYRGAVWLLDRAHAGNRVAIGLPGPGALYFLDHPWQPEPPGWPVRAPGPGWIVVTRTARPLGAVARIARALDIARFLPRGLARKLIPPPDVATLYRIPPESPGPHADKRGSGGFGAGDQPSAPAARSAAMSSPL